MSLISMIGFSVLSSVIAVWLYRTFEKFRTWFLLRELNGEYSGFDLNGSRHTEDKKYTYSYCFNNVFSIKNILVLKMSSKNRGNWVSKMLIYDSNPLIGSGTFKYDDANDWGRHEIQVNESDKEIYVHTICLSRKSIKSDGEYIIKKVN